MEIINLTLENSNKGKQTFFNNLVKLKNDSKMIVTIDNKLYFEISKYDNHYYCLSNNQPIDITKSKVSSLVNSIFYKT